MAILYIGLIIIISGIAYVAWLLWNEEKNSVPHEKKALPGDKGSNNIAFLLDRLGLGESLKGKTEGPISKLLSSLRQWQGQRKAIPAGTGTAALKLDEEKPVTKATAPEAMSASAIELGLKNKESQKEFTQLQDKHHKLEALFQEKSILLNKTEVVLDNELKSRKEFNKVKDLLEKELKDSRDKYHNLKIEAANAQTETESHLKRIGLLEEKIKKTEKDFQGKEFEVQAALKETENVRTQSTQLHDRLKSTESLIHEKDKIIGELVNQLKDMAPQTTQAFGQTTKTPSTQLSDTPPGAISEVNEEPKVLENKSVKASESKEAIISTSEPQQPSPAPGNIDKVSAVTQKTSAQIPSDQVIPTKGDISDSSIKTPQDQEKPAGESAIETTNENKEPLAAPAIAEKSAGQMAPDKTQVLKSLLDSIERPSAEKSSSAKTESAISNQNLDDKTTSPESHNPENSSTKTAGDVEKELQDKVTKKLINEKSPSQDTKDDLADHGNSSQPLTLKNKLDSELSLAPDVLAKQMEEIKKKIVKETKVNSDEHLKDKDTKQGAPDAKSD